MLRLPVDRQVVVINLCIDTKLTRLLGVENHVCELQLCMRRLVVEVRNADELSSNCGLS